MNSKFKKQDQIVKDRVNQFFKSIQLSPDGMTMKTILDPKKMIDYHRNKIGMRFHEKILYTQKLHKVDEIEPLALQLPLSDSGLQKTMADIKNIDIKELIMELRSNAQLKPLGLFT